MFQCFVSYSHKDKGKVESIIKLLSAIFGNEITFWLDNIKINGGQSIPEKVREKKEIFNQPDDFFEKIYEALLQASRAIHNRGPHIDDVKDSIGFFDQLANTNKSISF